MTNDRCINCGHQFASGQDAEDHNWCCTDCHNTGGIRAVEDPADPDIAMTPTGAVIFRMPDPDPDPDPDDCPLI